MRSKYIHYGHKIYDKDEFQPIKNIPMFTKPSGGLWACRADAETSWKEYCDDLTTISIEEDNLFCFEISEDAKVLRIDSYEMLEQLPKVEGSSLSSVRWLFLDFEKLSSEYDAIEVFMSENFAIMEALYGWDVDCILIFNPDIVEA